MKKESLILIICCLLFSCLPQPETGAYIKMVFTDAAGGKLNYNVLYPTGFKLNNKKKNPLILFLHGAGERGDDNLAQLKHISDVFMEEAFMKKQQAVVLFPQCPADDYWVNKSDGFKVDSKVEPTASMKKVIALMEQIRKEGYIDESRIYITGLSMGGMGTLDLLSRKADWFAGAIAVCGAGDPNTVAAYKEVPLQLFHGVKDSVVPHERSKEIHESLEKIAGQCELTLYPEGGHDIWNEVYKNNNKLKWLMNQKK